MRVSPGFFWSVLGFGVTVAGSARAEDAPVRVEPPAPLSVAPALEPAPPVVAPALKDDPSTASPSNSNPLSENQGKSRLPESEVAPGTDSAMRPSRIKDTPHGGFVFGSFGRVSVAGDGTGRPGRESDFVAHGSRLDAANYVELELRREDSWEKVGIDTRIVSTLAIGNSIFHYDGTFDSQLAVRNLYLEANGLGTKGVSAWAGSRMLRGDDIYLLNFWPLDNLNTLGAGVRYQAPTRTTAQVHMGLARPDNPFYRQEAARPAPLNQFGAATVNLLERQRWLGSARIEQQFPLGEKAGVKLVGYGEAHRLPAGQRETERPGTYEDVPEETGFVIGGQVGAWGGERATHVNLFARYSQGIAAYGEFATPAGLGPDHTTRGAHELLFAAGGNWEWERLAIMGSAYVRSFRNASRALDAGDVDEGIVLVRPQLWFLDWLGLGLEASYQLAQRGTLVTLEPGAEPRPLVASMTRLGVMPFISPAGRGSFSRPMLWLIYSVGFRNAHAQALYPVDDAFASRTVEHFVGAGAEWWFGSSSYGGGT